MNEIGASEPVIPGPLTSRSKSAVAPELTPEAASTDQVQTAAERFAAGGIEHRVEEEVCCYAPQNKVITHDPDGTMFECYRVLGDSTTFFASASE